MSPVWVWITSEGRQLADELPMTPRVQEKAVRLRFNDCASAEVGWPGVQVRPMPPPVVVAGPDQYRIRSAGKVALCPSWVTVNGEESDTLAVQPRVPDPETLTVPS